MDMMYKYVCMIIDIFCFLMRLLPPRPKRTNTLFPYTTLFLSHPRRQWQGLAAVRALPYRARDADAHVRGQQPRALEQVMESRCVDDPMRVVRTFPGSSLLEMASSPNRRGARLMMPAGSLAGR